MSYQLKSIKTMEGREGEAFSANLYYDNKKIADVRDDGNGGSLHIGYINREVREEHTVALTNWHRANCVDDYSRGLKSDDEAAIELLYSFQENDKKSRNAILFQTGPDLSALTDEEVKRWFFTGNALTEIANYRIRNASIQNKKTLRIILAEHPTAQVWDAENHRYKKIKELL